MRRARRRGDTPAGMGRGSTLGAVPGQQQAWGCAARGGEDEPSGGSEVQLPMEADHERQGLRAQPLLHRPEPIDLPRGLDDDQLPRIEPEMLQAGCIRRAPFARERRGQTQQHGVAANRRRSAAWRTGLGLAGERPQTPHRKADRKRQRRQHVLMTGRLDLVQSAGVESAIRQGRIELRIAKAPARQPAWRARAHLCGRGGGETSAAATPLDDLDAGTQVGQQCGGTGCGMRE